MLQYVALYWLYPENDGSRRTPVHIPDEIAELANEINTINDKETLQVTANIWKAMVQLPKLFPSFKRLIPGVCAFWNVVKGGSDTATKLMDDRKMRVPKKHLNPETATVTRIIMLMLVTIHRLIQIETAKKELGKYSTLYHFQNEASHQATFHESLITITRIMEEDMERVGGTVLQNTTNTRRRNPNCKILKGVIPTPTTFGAKLSCKTPRG